MDEVLTSASKIVRNVYFVLLLLVFIGCVALIGFLRATTTLDDTLIENQKQIIETQSLNKQILQSILDCTEPSGECAADQKATTQEAVSTINLVSILAATCSQTIPLTNETYTEDVIECVQIALEKQQIKLSKP